MYCRICGKRISFILADDGRCIDCSLLLKSMSKWDVAIMKVMDGSFWDIAFNDEFQAEWAKQCDTAAGVLLKKQVKAGFMSNEREGRKRVCHITNKGRAAIAEYEENNGEVELIAPTAESSPHPRALPESITIDDAAKTVIAAGTASNALLHRELGVDYATGARLLDELERAGVVGPYRAGAPREVLMSLESYTACKATTAHADSAAENGDADKQTVLDFDCMDGHQFEQFCAAVLQRAGFSNVTVTKMSGDNGIDVLADRDAITYGIQCKCYSENVGCHAVQEAWSGARYYNRMVAVVLINRHFTPQAIEMAQQIGVALWDRDHLLTLLRQGEGGCPQ